MWNKVYNTMKSKNYVRQNISIQKTLNLTFKLESYLKFLAIRLFLIIFLFKYLIFGVFCCIMF